MLHMLTRVACLINDRWVDCTSSWTLELKPAFCLFPSWPVSPFLHVPQSWQPFIPALLPLVWHFAPSTLDYIGLSTGIPWSWKSGTPSTVLTFSAINYAIVPNIIWYNVGLSGWVEWYKLICCNCWNTETDQFVHMIWSIVVQWRWDIVSSGHRKSIGLGS